MELSSEAEVEAHGGHGDGNELGRRGNGGREKEGPGGPGALVHAAGGGASTLVAASAAATATATATAASSHPYTLANMNLNAMTGVNVNVSAPVASHCGKRQPFAPAVAAPMPTGTSNVHTASSPGEDSGGEIQTTRQYRQIKDLISLLGTRTAAQRHHVPASAAPENESRAGGTVETTHVLC